MGQRRAVGPRLPPVPRARLHPLRLRCPPRRSWLASSPLRSLRAGLGDRLAGVYLVGSAALGDWHAGVSDVDVAVLTHGEIPAETLDRARRPARPPTPPRMPARRLELVVYTAARVAARDATFSHEPQRRGRRPGGRRPRPGRRAAVLVRARPGDRARARGRAGRPPAAEAIGAPPEAEVRAALEAAVDWYADTGATPRRCCWPAAARCTTCGRARGRARRPPPAGPRASSRSPLEARASSRPSGRRRGTGPGRRPPPRRSRSRGSRPRSGTGRRRRRSRRRRSRRRTGTRCGGGCRRPAPRSARPTPAGSMRRTRPAPVSAPSRRRRPAGTRRRARRGRGRRSRAVGVWMLVHRGQHGDAAGWVTRRAASRSRPSMSPSSPAVLAGLERFES